MALALGVHSKAAGGNGVTSRQTPAVNTQASGSTFVVAVSDPNQDIRVTDNKGNAKFRRAVLVSGSGSKSALFICVNGTGGTGHQATVTWLSGSADTAPTFHEITAQAGYSAVLELLASTIDNSAPQSVTSAALGGTGRFSLVMAASETIVSDYNESNGYSLSEQETDYNLYWTHAVRYKANVGAAAETASFATIGSGVSTLLSMLVFKEVQTTLQLGDSGQDFQLDNAGTSPSTISLNTAASGSVLLAFAAGEFAKMNAPTYNGGAAMTQIETSGYHGGAWPGFGFKIYSQAISGGSGHVLSMVKPVSPAQESTLIGVEIRGGGTVIDSNIGTVAAPGAGVAVVSPSVTTTGPAMLVALWGGDGGVGTTDQAATPGDGWLMVESRFLGSTAYIQAAVAVKFVEAGTHTASWTAVANQGAILGIVALGTGGGSTTVDLAGNAAAVASASAALQLLKGLAATAAARAAASAAMGHGVPLAASSQAVAAATAALSKAALLAVAAAGSTGVSGQVALAVPLAGVAAGLGSGSGAIALSKPLAGQSAAQGAATGNLSTNAVASLAGDAAARAAAAAALQLNVSLVAASLAQSSASAALSHGVPLAANAVGQVGASANLSTSSGLQGAAVAVASSTGQLALSIALQAAALAQAGAGATLNGAITLGGQAAAAAGVSGTLLLTVPLTAQAQQLASAGGGLVLTVVLGGDGQARASSSGAFATDVLLAGAAGVQVSVTGQLAQFTLGGTTDNAWWVLPVPRQWVVRSPRLGNPASRTLQ